MSGYDFLHGIRVLEVAQLGPSSLGGLLADMGAEVIKVEGADGDPIRATSEPAVGSTAGPSFLHLRWNRGKKSLGLDLKKPEGIALFKRLAAQSDVVIEGMRAGVLDRLGLGYETLKAGNPKLVFCSISGLGRSGPYSSLGSQGPSFDAFAALAAINPANLTEAERQATPWTPIGMYAMGLFGALGTLAAIVKAQRTGEGALIEVSGAESAAHWLPEGVNKALNPGLMHPRPGFRNDQGRMARWPRLQAYETGDGRRVLFQGFYDKFWQRFCAFVGRPDLLDPSLADATLHGELVQIFRSRSHDEWMRAFLENDIAGSPVNTLETLAADPHFLARDNVYEAEHPGIGTLRLTSTPVKTPGQHFKAAPAPEQWAHSAEVLGEWLGLGSDELQRLSEAGAVMLKGSPAR
ncbi:CaiB/BaiF CoA-transferase family protein [Pelomonas sp. KK5]|uniref:CaiB/BaiF CoA transferase family protein n=1 Tax=Pelomonas sp. KK5 TaxID=1855730 RepID=UPI00097C0E4A|nr:CaiB/BaiF CoA-transferase family protein [Pelomonas sp. KK5]